MTNLANEILNVERNLIQVDAKIEALDDFLGDVGHTLTVEAADHIEAEICRLAATAEFLVERLNKLEAMAA